MKYSIPALVWPGPDASTTEGDALKRQQRKMVKPRLADQRRRRDILVGSPLAGFQSSVGATYFDAAPTGLVHFMGTPSYKDVAPKVLPLASQRRIVAELDALQAKVVSHVPNALGSKEGCD